MNVTYEHKPAMTFIGFSTSIRPKEWYPTEGQKYMGNGNAMLEVYSPGDMKSPDYECGIWVPICKSAGQKEQEAAEIVSTMTITGIL